MRDYEKETELRVAFIRDRLAESGAKGIVYGNSGGKDSALVGILCKKACDNTLGLLLPCQSRRNYDMDTRDALAVAEQFHIESRTVDLGPVKALFTEALSAAVELTADAQSNVNPRLRMISLYAVAAAESRLVAGTGNRSEVYMGYFTKWGDGAFDFNPIGDLTVTEIYEFLRYLGAPEAVIQKAPSAGLYEGQTDEAQLGVTYAAIDRYLAGGQLSPAEQSVIERWHRASEHKRRAAPVYGQGK